MDHQLMELINIRKALAENTEMVDELTRTVGRWDPTEELKVLKWEYEWLNIKDEDYERDIQLLDEAGKDRWEVTGITEDTGFGTRYLMKRPDNNL